MKRFVSIVMTVFLLVLLILPASAAEAPEYCVFDYERLLTDEEYRTLEDYAQDISERQQCAVYFLTVDDFRNYGDGEIFDVARQIFLAINVCVDKAVVLHDGNGPSCDSVAVCLRIAVVVMLNIGSFYQVCQNKRQRNHNDIAKS